MPWRWMQPKVGESWRIKGRKCLVKDIVPAPVDSSSDNKELFVVKFQDGKEETISDVEWEKLQPWGPYG